MTGAKSLPRHASTVGIPALAVGFASTADYFAPGFTRWPIGLLTALPLFAWLLARPGRGRLVAILSVLAWLIVLPKIPWHDYKRFYIDCRRIESGATVAEVRALMHPYHLQYDASKSATQRPDGLALLFHPSLSRSADWCQVYGTEFVAHVSISPD